MKEKQRLELKGWKSTWIHVGVDKHRKERVKQWNILKTLYDIKEEIPVALDIGCGAFGGMSLAVNAKKWILLDPLMNEYRKMYKSNKPHRYINAFGESMPLDKDSVDVVFSTNTLDHTDRPVLCLKEIYRIMKPGGYFYLWTSCRTKEHLDVKHPHMFKLKTLSKWLKDIGFEIVNEDKVTPTDKRWNTHYLTYMGVARK